MYDADEHVMELMAEVKGLRESAKLADEMYEQAATQANDYAAENAALRAEVERLRAEVAMYRSALANALGIPHPMLAPPKKEE